MNNILVLFACVAAVTCNDLRVGSIDNGRVIFDEKIQASPAIWRQVQKITVNASDYEVISQVVVTDQRPEKDGDAKIVEGGEGQKNVTIELQSPTVFRGFDFHVVVYAIQENGGQRPILISKDTEVNTSSEPKDEDSVSVNDSVTPSDVKPTVSTVEEKPMNGGSEPNAPAVIDQTRQYRNTEEQSRVDPIVQYVSEKTTEVPAEQKTVSTEANTADNAQKTNAPLSPAVLGHAQFNTEAPFQTNKDVTDEAKVPSKDVPQIKDLDVKILEDISTTPKYATSEASDVKISPFTENIQDQMTGENFDSISKELGQKVLLGIRKH